MQKRKKGRVFNRSSSQRLALFRSQARELILRGRMNTTLAKAKELRPKIEKMVSRARVDNLANRRLLLRHLSPQVVNRLFKEVAPKYKERAGGYTRITKTGLRGSDKAKTALIEFV